jgi:hypothetical protein
LGNQVNILGYVLIAAGVAVFVSFFLILLPRVIVRRVPPAQLSNVPEAKDRLTLEHERLKLRNEFRTTCITFVSGLALIAGVLVAFRQFQTSQNALTESLRTSREQLDVAQQVARNQQYVENVHNLSDGDVTVRVAAVEVIDDIAQLGDNERAEASSILVAHVQQRAPWPPPPGDPYPPDADASSMPSLFVRKADVSVALLRLGERDLAKETLNLEAVDLRSADLRDTDYSGRYFFDVHLNYSLLDRIDLQGAILRNTDLSDSTLDGAKLCGAALDTTNLTGVSLRGAIADNQTQWPEGFDYAAAGVKNATGPDCT